jgi:adenine-specific DNA-methyltransferase
VKNLDLITKLVDLGSDKDSLVLDFFAGSGTTAEALSNLNTKDKGTRKFILVQLPEPNNNIEDGKISDLTVNRLKIKQIDFRKFSLDISNFISWDGNLENNKIENQLKFAIESVNQSSSEFDLLYEILIKSGFLLTEKIVVETTSFGKIFIICDGALIICLEKKLTNSIIEYIAKKEPARVILADSGFNNNDELKTNAVQIMKSHNINDFKTI